MLPSIAEPPSPSPRPSVDTRPVNMSLSPSSLSGERWSPRTRRSAGPSSSAGRKGKCCGAFSWGYKWLGALTFRPLDRAPFPVGCPWSIHRAEAKASTTPVRKSEMFSHVMVASSDIDRSKKFYDALFEAVGGKPGEQDARGRLRYVYNGGVLMVSKPIDGKPATHSNGGTIGLSMASPEKADAWHKTG